jgi:S-adenosylmethionine synthetase
MPVQTSKSRRAPSPVVISDLPSHEEISARAYSLFEARGAGHGDDLNDWLEAEHELLQEYSDRVGDLRHADD